jgi:hypothetical protein
VTALQCNLDPDRLLPHSNRAGANMHLEDFDASVKMAQGNWSSRPGMRSYVHGSLQHASKITSALHDIQMCPVAQLRTFFMPSPDPSWPFRIPGTHSPFGPPDTVGLVLRPCLPSTLVSIQLGLAGRSQRLSYTQLHS